MIFASSAARSGMRTVFSNVDELLSRYLKLSVSCGTRLPCVFISTYFLQPVTADKINMEVIILNTSFIVVVTFSIRNYYPMPDCKKLPVVRPAYSHSGKE